MRKPIDEVAGTDATVWFTERNNDDTKQGKKIFVYSALLLTARRKISLLGVGTI